MTSPSDEARLREYERKLAHAASAPGDGHPLTIADGEWLVARIRQLEVENDELARQISDLHAEQ